jgi:hypothetical protein
MPGELEYPEDAADEDVGEGASAVLEKPLRSQPVASLRGAAARVQGDVLITSGSAHAWEWLAAGGVFLDASCFLRIRPAVLLLGRPLAAVPWYRGG